MLRTTVQHKKEKTFTFPMNNNDILERVDEVNELKAQEASLDAKRKLIANEMKQKSAESNFKLDCIARREEPRKVECDVIFDYENRKIETLFLGQVMESKKMSDWEFDERPTDIYPETHKNKVEAVQPSENMSLKDAADRAEEIMTKEAKIQTPSANVNEFSDAKAETAVEGLNVG